MNLSKEVNYRNCPLCNNSKVSLIKNLSYALFDDSPISRSFDLVSCEHCNFIFFDTPTKKTDLYQYYHENLHYLSNNYGTGSTIEKEECRYISILSILKKYDLKRKNKIIDVGSAKGGFLFFLKKNGYENLRAIELLPECVNYIRVNGISAYEGSADSIPVPDHSVDIIVLSHVLEHIIDLKPVIEEIFRVLSDSGLIYVEVPTLEYGCSFKNAPLWDLIYEHVNYFTQQHLLSYFLYNNYICLESDVKEIINGDGRIKYIYGLFKKNGTNSINEIKGPNLVEYFKELFNYLGDINESIIKDIAINHIPCYIWGISEYMQLLIASTSIKECNIISFLDISEYKQTKKINNIPIASPQILEEITSDAILIFPAEPNAVSMKQYLDKISFLGKRILI